MDLKVTVDASALERWAEELSTRGLKNAIRRAVDQSARAARKIAVKVIAADIGVSAAKIKSATPKVKTTTATNLSASWTVSAMRIGIKNTAGAKIRKSGGLTASTHKLTGGGSAALHAPHAFLVKTAKGGEFVAYRKTGARLPLKAIYAETPRAAMAQSDAAARMAWNKAANAELSIRLPREVSRQFYSERLSAATPDSGD